MGMSVEISVLLKNLDRRRVVFEITVNDDFDLVGHGTHERFITDSVKSTENFQKLKKLGFEIKQHTFCSPLLSVC